MIVQKGLQSRSLKSLPVLWALTLFVCFLRSGFKGYCGIQSQPGVCSWDGCFSRAEREQPGCRQSSCTALELELLRARAGQDHALPGPVMKMKPCSFICRGQTRADLLALSRVISILQADFEEKGKFYLLCKSRSVQLSLHCSFTTSLLGQAGCHLLLW